MSTPSMLCLALAGVGLFFVLGEVWVQWRARKHWNEIERNHERMKRELNESLLRAINQWRHTS